MIKNHTQILNEGFTSYFKRLEESMESIYDEWTHLDREPIIEFPNGSYLYVVVDPDSKSMYAGSATNTGIFREYEIEIDEDESFDSNLNALYDYIIEESPEFIEDGEELDAYYDDLMSESLNEEYEEVDISDYKYVGNVDGFYTYRKIVRNGDKVKGIWAAQDQDEKNPPFAITYNQALGYEPITKYESNAKKLGRELGKVLLPKRGSKNESYNLKRNRNTKSLRESLLNEAPNISIPKDSLNDPSSISLRGIAKDAVEKEEAENRARAEKEEKDRLGKQAQSKLQEILSVNEENNDLLESIFEVLVPSSGKCDTLAGELARAMMKIEYRYFNDGDFFFDGYGYETCGPAAAFLMEYAPKELGIMESLFKIAQKGDSLVIYPDRYEEEINNIGNELSQFIIDNPYLIATPNKKDMLNDYDEGLLKDIKSELPKCTFDVDTNYEELEVLLDLGLISDGDIQDELEAELEHFMDYESEAYVERWAKDAYAIADLTPCEFQSVSDDMNGIQNSFDMYVDDLKSEYQDEIEQYYEDDYEGGEELEESLSLNEDLQYNLSWLSSNGEDQMEVINDVSDISNLLMKIEKEGGRNIVLKSISDKEGKATRSSKYFVIPDSNGQWGFGTLDRYLISAIKSEYNYSTKDAIKYARKINERERDRLVKEFKSKGKMTESYTKLLTKVSRIALTESL